MGWRSSERDRSLESNSARPRTASANFARPSKPRIVIYRVSRASPLDAPGPAVLESQLSWRMMGQMIQFRSEHDLPFSCEVVWPALTNTDWFNRALGLPAVRYEFQQRAEGGSSTIARARLAGFEIVWTGIALRVAGTRILSRETDPGERTVARSDDRVGTSPSTGRVPGRYHLRNSPPQHAREIAGREDRLPEDDATMSVESWPTWRPSSVAKSRSFCRD